MTAGEGIYREAALMNPDDDIYRPAGLGGDGWWDDAVTEAKRVGKRIQKSKTVRGLEKRVAKATVEGGSVSVPHCHFLFFNKLRRLSDV